MRVTSRLIVQRFGSILLVVFMSLWLGVVVPGHQRGQLTPTNPAERLSDLRTDARTEGLGPTLEAGGGLSCCAKSEPSDDPKQTGKRAPKGSCPVCSFMATLMVPPVFVLDMPWVDVLRLVEAHATLCVARSCSIPCWQTRGPPTIA